MFFSRRMNRMLFKNALGVALSGESNAKRHAVRDDRVKVEAGATHEMCIGERGMI
jgi:hypothetical protein